MVRLSRAARVLMALTLCGGLAAATFIRPAALPVVDAEEAPTIIHLAYQPGYCNYGPTNATGTARLWPSEGVVTLTVHNLPRLEPGSTYASWIVNTTTGEALGLGTFNASTAGAGEQDVIFNQALPRGANAIVVTVMNPGEPAGLPGPERSLAGYFPPVGGAAPVTRSRPQQHTAHGRAIKSSRSPAHSVHKRAAAHKPARPAVSSHHAHGLAPRARQARHGTAHPAHHPVVVVLPTTGGGSPGLGRCGSGGHRCGLPA